MPKRRECRELGCTLCTGACPYGLDGDPELRVVTRNGDPHICDGTGEIFTNEDEGDVYVDLTDGISAEDVVEYGGCSGDADEGEDPTEDLE